MYLLTEQGKICGGGESHGAHSLPFTKKPPAREATSLLGLAVGETGSWHPCEQAREGLSWLHAETCLLGQHRGEVEMDPFCPEISILTTSVSRMPCLQRVRRQGTCYLSSGNTNQFIPLCVFNVLQWSEREKKNRKLNCEWLGWEKGLGCGREGF